jgi:hypothetical protein
MPRENQKLRLQGCQKKNLLLILQQSGKDQIRRQRPDAAGLLSEVI